VAFGASMGRFGGHREPEFIACDPCAMWTRTITAITLATAGRLQAIANDGGLQSVKESDLRSAIRDSAYPHATAVTIEVPIQLRHWPRVGGVDVQITDRADRLMIECKWCHDKDKLAEVVWDALKLASATTADKTSTGLIVAAASDSVWKLAPVSALFAEQCWTLGDLLGRFAAEWSWLYRSVSVARPRRLPAMIDVTDHQAAAIHVAGAQGWTLRALTVIGSADADMGLNGIGQPLAEHADAIDAPTEAAMQGDAADEARADLARMLHTRTPAQAVFEDPSIDEDEKQRRLVRMRDGLDPSSDDWPDVDGFLRSMQMRKDIRESEEQ
jgi:hypothetical protein